MTAPPTPGWRADWPRRSWRWIAVLWVVLAVLFELQARHLIARGPPTPVDHAAAVATPIALSDRAVDVPTSAMLFARQPFSAPALREGQPNIEDLRFFAEDPKRKSFGYGRDRWWALIPVTLPSSPAIPWFVSFQQHRHNGVLAFRRCGAEPWKSLKRVAARNLLYEAGFSGPSCDILVMLETPNSVEFRISLVTVNEIADTTVLILAGIAIGASIIVAIFVTYLLILTKKMEYIYFIFYQISTSVVCVSLYGIVIGYIGDDFVHWADISINAGTTFFVFTLYNYGKHSLNFPSHYTNLAYIFDVIMTLPIFLIIPCEYLEFYFQELLLPLYMGVGTAFYLGMIALSWRTSHGPALRQAIGFLPTILCFLRYLGAIIGYAPMSDVMTWFILGQSASSVVFGLGMAVAVKQDRDRRENGLAATIAELRQSRAELETYQNDLEGMVVRRTAELERALENERAIVLHQRDFTSMVGHEFRTPLAVIDGQAQRIENTAARRGEGDLSRRTREIRDAVQGMITLMDGLLNHARAENGFKHCRFDTVTMTDVITRAIEVAVPPERFGDVETSLEDGLLCRGDHGLLCAAIGNLLANAAKYSPAGSVIEVRAAASGDQVTVSVADHGIGIAANEIELIFARYQRGSNTRATEGTGLGLHAARQIIEIHGGSISVQSSLGEGTLLTILLPRHSAVEGADAG